MKNRALSNPRQCLNVRQSNICTNTRAFGFLIATHILINCVGQFYILLDSLVDSNVKLQDFPINSQSVFLSVKCLSLKNVHQWILESTGEQKPCI